MAESAIVVKKLRNGSGAKGRQKSKNVKGKQWPYTAKTDQHGQ
jgi:hypothetical protein